MVIIFHNGSFIYFTTPGNILCCTEEKKKKQNHKINKIYGSERRNKVQQPMKAAVLSKQKHMEELINRLFSGITH